MKRLLASSTLFLLPIFLLAQTTPFNRGVNLTNWFQAGNVRQIQPNRYTFTDFEQIQSLGCDVIRLPINLHFMTSGAPDYVIDPLLFDFLDPVVEWADSLDLHLILDNHTFDPSANTDPNVGDILEKVWLQMATHYANGYERLYYEVLNEPHGIADALWGTIQGDVIDVIRTVDSTHTIIVGPAGWNSYNNLAYLPQYQDTNLIYTFHFYDPFIFTHQGASWTDPSMEPLENVPFPYNAANMPPFPASLNGTWIQNAFNNYAAEGTVQKLNELFDIAETFRNQRGVPVFCGEFGVFMNNSDPAERVTWYQEVRNILESRYISWTIWDYHGGFGIFEPGSQGLFDHDLNTDLISALGLNVPPQTPYQPKTDTVGFLLYDDALGAGILESSYNNDKIDYYAPDYPNSGKYTLKWSGAEQYNSIGMDFVPDRDLSQLVNEGFALDLMIRGDVPGTTFDIRFLDTKTTAPGDHPWRIRVTIDQQLTWDKRWYHLHLPLSSFAEHGSWDNNTWYNPEGKFDWSAIDRLEIVAEHQALPTATVWLDQIWITDQDTAQVRENRALSMFPDHQVPLAVMAFPNPFHDHLTIRTTEPQPVHLNIFDLQGKLIETRIISDTETLSTLPWSPGIYLLEVSARTGARQTLRLIKTPD